MSEISNIFGYFSEKLGIFWEIVVNYGIMDKTHYLGAAKLRLDERGRLAVPKNLRAVLTASAVLTAHPHGCLVVYSEKRFAEVRQTLLARANTSYSDAHMEELIVGSAETLQLDSAERFLVGGHLRNYAGIARDVRLFNLPDSVRLWGEERWAQKHALITARLQDEGFSDSWRDLRL